MAAWTRLQNILLSLALLGAGLAAGYALGRQDRPRHARNYPVRGDLGDLTNPLLDFEILDFDELDELKPFRAELRDLIARIEEDGKVEQVSVYYRDLNNGPWIGLREEREFVPGSLFKVPLIIACLRQAERDHSFLERKIKAIPSPHPDMVSYHYPPPFQLETGREYTVQDLIQRTCRFSDNLAAWLLAQAVDKEILKKVLFDLDIDPDLMFEQNVWRFSPVEFGRFFRILYNASYLSREMSEFALGNFAQSTFRAGLTAGVPAGTLVAHKFGENVETVEGKKLFTLHDVGIVYHKRRPYLLCVMTRGTDYDAQARAIASCSTLVWHRVDRQPWASSSR